MPLDCKQSTIQHLLLLNERRHDKVVIAQQLSRLYLLLYIIINTDSDDVPGTLTKDLLICQTRTVEAQLEDGVLTPDSGSSSSSSCRGLSFGLHNVLIPTKVAVISRVVIVVGGRRQTLSAVACCTLSSVHVVG